MLFVLCVACDRILSTINDMDDADMNEMTFTEFAKTHPTMLYPTITIQTQMRRKVLGEKKWKSFARIRSARNIERAQLQQLYNDMRPNLGVGIAAAAAGDNSFATSAKGTARRGAGGGGARRPSTDTNHATYAVYKCSAKIWNN